MQQTPSARLWLLPALALCVFGVMVAVLLRVVPGPHGELDYLVIGTVSVMASLLLVFLVWIKAGAAKKKVTSEAKARPPASMSILGDLSGDKA